MKRSSEIRPRVSSLGRSGLCAAIALALVAVAQPCAIGAPIEISDGPNLIGDPTCGQELDGGTNFPDAEVEPWVAVNPANPANIIAVWQQDRWSNGGARALAAGVSMDGGTNWIPVLLPGTSDCTDGPFFRASDPWVDFSSDGTAYFMALVFDNIPLASRPGGFGPNGMTVSTSIDGGHTWSDPEFLVVDENPRNLHDKNSLTADPNVDGVVYAVWDRLRVPTGAAINPENVFGLGSKGPVAFTRTTDFGQTWQPIRFIYDPGGNNQTIGNQIVVLPEGTVIDFFNEILNFRNDDGGNQFDFNLSFVYSTDLGNNWLPRGNRAVRTGLKLESLALFRAFGILTPDGEEGLRTADILLDVAVDPVSGALYAVWQDASFSGFSHDEIAMAVSTDGGFTWTPKFKVNTTPVDDKNPLRAQAYTPSVAVASDGSVAVTYYDFRADVGAAGNPRVELTEYFAVVCATNCTDPASWQNALEIPLTTAPFDATDAPIARGFFIGDYMGLTTDGADFIAVFEQAGVGSGPSSIFFERF